MGESLMMQRRVRDEGLRVVNRCQELGKVRVLISPGIDWAPEEAPANYVPAAAVIRREQALLGITGHKGGVGGYDSPM